MHNIKVFILLYTFLISGMPVVLKASSVYMMPNFLNRIDVIEQEWKNASDIQTKVAQATQLPPKLISLIMGYTTSIQPTPIPSTMPIGDSQTIESAPPLVAAPPQTRTSILAHCSLQ